MYKIIMFTRAYVHRDWIEKLSFYSKERRGILLGMSEGRHLRILVKLLPIPTAALKNIHKMTDVSLGFQMLLPSDFRQPPSERSGFGVGVGHFGVADVQSEPEVCQQLQAMDFRSEFIGVWSDLISHLQNFVLNKSTPFLNVSDRD